MFFTNIRHTILIALGLLTTVGCRQNGKDAKAAEEWQGDPNVDAGDWPFFDGEEIELPKTSQDLIMEAYDQGEIDDETFYLLSVQAVFMPSDLPTQYSGADPVEAGGYDVSPLLSAVSVKLDTFSPDVQEVLRPFVLPPTDPSSYWYEENMVALDDLYDTGADAGAMDDLADAGVQATKVLPVVNKDPDGYEYFIDLESTADLQTGITVRNALTKAGNKYKASGFPEPTDWVLVSLKTDPVNNKGKPIDGATFWAVVEQKKRCNIIIKKNQSDTKLAATAAHELFHCVQLHYPLREFPNDAWLAESTAVWAEEFVYPEANTEHDYDKLIFPTFDKYFFDTSSDRNYGGYLWWFYLYQNAGKHHSPIREALTVATSPGTEKKALEARSNFKREHKDYALWNVNAEPFVYYQDYDAMPVMTPRPPGLKRGTVTPNPASPQNLEMEPGGINYYAYKIDNRVDKLKIDLRGANDKVFPEIGIQMIYKIDDNWLYLDVSSEDELVFCRRRPSERVMLLLLIFNNPNLDDTLLGGEFTLDGSEHCAPEWSGYVNIHWSDGDTVTDLPTLSGDETVGTWAENGVINMRDSLVYDSENDEYLIKQTFYNYSFSEWQSITYSRECGLLYESDRDEMSGGGSRLWDIDPSALWMSDAPSRFESADEGQGIYTFNLGPAVGKFISRSESITEQNTCDLWGIATPAPPEHIEDVWKNTYDSEVDGYVPVADPNIYDVRVKLSKDGKRLTGVGDGDLVYGDRVIPVYIDIDYTHN